MSEETQEQPQEEKVDPIKDIESQLKSQDGKMDKFIQSQEQLIAAINGLNLDRAPARSESQAKSLDNEDFTQLLLSDPNKAVKLLESQIEQNIQSKLSKQTEKEAEVNQVLSKLNQEFPELSNLEHPLTKDALSIYDKMSKREKESPMAYEVAVSRAAMNAGILPKNKRKTSDSGEFSLGSKGPSSAAPAKAKLSEATLHFAAKMGLDVSDPKVLENLKKRGAV